MTKGPCVYLINNRVAIEGERYSSYTRHCKIDWSTNICANVEIGRMSRDDRYSDEGCMDSKRVYTGDVEVSECRVVQNRTKPKHAIGNITKRGNILYVLGSLSSHPRHRAPMPGCKGEGGSPAVIHL